MRKALLASLTDLEVNLVLKKMVVIDTKLLSVIIVSVSGLALLFYLRLGGLMLDFQLVQSA